MFDFIKKRDSLEVLEEDLSGDELLGVNQPKNLPAKKRSAILPGGIMRRGTLIVKA